MDADRIAVDAPQRFAGLDVAHGAAGVAEDELVRGERERLADGRRGEPFGQGRGDGLRRMVRLASKIVRLIRSTQASSAVAPTGNSTRELVLVDQSRQDHARPVDLARCAASRARS